MINPSVRNDARSDDPRNVVSEKKPLSDRIVDSIEGKDEPMGKRQPAAPLAMALWAYPLILIVGCIIVVTAFWWWRG